MSFTEDNFVPVDAVLMPWLKRNTLYVYKWLRDDPVRMIDVVDDAGNTYHINISPPDVAGMMRIIVSGSGQRNDFEASLLDLEQVLDKSFFQILGWIKQAGFTRTPV